jgi:hypothetical protein
MLLNLKKGIKMKKLAFIALLIMATQQSLMAWSTSPVTKIDRLFTYQSYAVLAIANTTVDTENCANNNFVAFDITTDGGKALYAAALTAFTTGGKVRFGQHTCINWSGGVPRVYRIEMIK